MVQIRCSSVLRLERNRDADTTEEVVAFGVGKVFKGDRAGDVRRERERIGQGQWTQYNKFKEIRATSSQCATGTCFVKKENFKDTYRWAVGTTYTLNPTWTLRYGFAIDQNAGQATLSIPDTDRYWYSAGATYHYNPALSVDLGVAYIHSKKADFIEQTPTGENDSFTSSGKAYLAAAQVNYRF